MLRALKDARKVTGTKQVIRAVRAGTALHVYFAEDADPRVTTPVCQLCDQLEIPRTQVATMDSLGRACGIAVGAAVAASVR